MSHHPGRHVATHLCSDSSAEHVCPVQGPRCCHRSEDPWPRGCLGESGALDLAGVLFKGWLIVKSLTAKIRPHELVLNPVCLLLWSLSGWFFAGLAEGRQVVTAVG